MRAYAGFVAILLIAIAALWWTAGGGQRSTTPSADANGSTAHETTQLDAARDAATTDTAARRALSPAGSEAQPPAPATLVFQIVERGSGAPVSDFAVVLVPAAGESISRITDARGEARFGNLAVGTYYLADPQWSGDAVTGEHRHVLEVERLGEVLGTVVDDAGRPVPGAEVWSIPGDEALTGARRAARAGAQGQFRFTAWGEGVFVWARHPGYAPSQMVGRLRGRADSDPVRLVVGTATAVVTGVVTAGGAPVAGARVLGSVNAEDLPGERTVQDVLIGLARRVPLPEQRTGADGRFRLDGVPPGRGEVLIRADGWATAQTSYRVGAGEQIDVALTLQIGASLVGVVMRGEDPVAGAAIRAGTPLGRRSTVTDAAGRFAIHHIPPGQMSAMALVNRSLIDRLLVTLSDGQRQEWSVQVPPGGTLVGRVLHADGRPAADWPVRADHGEIRCGGRTDGQGRFSINDVPLAACDILTLLYEGNNVLQPVLRDVIPGDEEIVVQLPPPPPKDSWLLLIVARTGERPLRSGQIILSNDELGWFHLGEITASEEPTRLGPLFAGLYQLRVRSPNTAAVWTSIEIPAAGEVHQRIELPDPVELIIELDRPADSDGMIYASAHGAVERMSAARQRGGNLLRLGDGSVRATDPLAPGSYRIEIFGDGMPHIERQVELVAGQPKRLLVNIPPTRDVSIDVDLPADTAPPRSVEIETFAADGRSLARWTRAWFQLPSTDPLTIRRSAARLRLTAAELHGEAELPPGDAEIQIPLRHR